MRPFLLGPVLLLLLVACRHELPEGNKDGPPRDQSRDQPRLDSPRFDGPEDAARDGRVDAPRSELPKIDQRPPDGPRAETPPKQDQQPDKPGKPDLVKPDGAKLDVATVKPDIKPAYVIWKKQSTSPVSCTPDIPVGGGATCTSPLTILRLDGQDITAGCSQAFTLSNAWAACPGPGLQGKTTPGTSGTCPSGKVIGGGCDCGSSVNVVRSFPSSSTTWSCGCVNGQPSAIQTVCASVPVFVGSGPCQTGEQLLGGGCDCGSGNLYSSAPNAAYDGWTCVCSGMAVIYSICAP